MGSEEVMPFIVNMAKRLSSDYGSEIVRKYETILDFDLNNGKLPGRNEVWPVPRLANEFFPRVYTVPYFGSSGIPHASVRVALTDEMGVERRREVGRVYKVWNGKIAASTHLAALTEEQRRANAIVASEASLKAKGLRPWTDEEIDRVFELATNDDLRYKYRGNVSLITIAKTIGRTRGAVRTCLAKDKERRKKFGLS